MPILALILSIAHAADDAPPKFPIVKPGGMIFARYQYDLTDGAEGANAFAVDRVYLRTDVAINKRFAARITLDADRMKPLEFGDGTEATFDTKYRVFVKHAYLAVKDLGPLELRAGMIDTPYAPYYDGFTDNRYITKSFADEFGLLDTADLGVALLGKHGDGLVDWNLSLLNGEGYGKVEVDAGKSVQARVTVDPLAKMEDRALPLTGFAAYSGHPTTGIPTLTWAGAAGFQMPRLLVWAEVMGKSEGDKSGFGYSGTLNPRLPKYAGLVFRYDHWDPDGATDDDATTALIGGVEKDFLDKVAVAVTYERSWADAMPQAAEHGIVVHMQAGF
ncbi:MAG: hypothetical protein Q8P41_03735 [Pseudomonadota bacterium]|nr:hypothetical protein [Pseudomonadota bacterium]